MPSAYLFDLDGTLYTDAGPVPGAVEVLEGLKHARIPFRYITNTSRRPRAAIVERLRGYGFPASAEHVMTAVLAAAELVRHRGHRVVAPFVAPQTLPDLGEFELVGGTSGVRSGAGAPDAIVLGDLGDGWSYSLLQDAFRAVMGGADVIALSRDRYWLRGDGLALDAGPFVAAIEYATGASARVAGKPSRDFFEAAIRSLGLGAGTSVADIAVVGDDVWSDVKGAQGCGLLGWLVRTGKFRADALASSGVTPDRIIDSVAAIS
ncbi:MAG TPA: TIGR01458 family HAD-type hydrolase [Gemmatimonadales bacterium]|nr:TIGR01458 family HAD-type hydrolase [Gemmatimonadales bacterium]